MTSLRDWTLKLKRACAVLQLALRHPRTPWYAKACGALTLLYALSPLDLIPDFIPVLGYLDDLVLVPLGLWLTIRLIPKPVWQECEAEAARRELAPPPHDRRGIVLIVLLCLGVVTEEKGLIKQYRVIAV
jgi:uncharacterized membrane protein YkvA (DUF1232 family)